MDISSNDKDVLDIPVVKYGYTYVPYQRLTKVSTPEVGLIEGTIFPELIDPWYPGLDVKQIEFLRSRGLERS